MEEQSARLSKQEHFAQRIPELQRYLLHVVLGWRYNLTDATEIAQEAIVRSWLYMDERQWVPDIENQKAFLYKTAQNLSFDLLRRRLRENLVSSVEPDEKLQNALDCKATECDTSATDVQQRIYLQELSDLLPWKVLFQGLSKEELQILRLNVCYDMSPEEIAKELELDVHALRYGLGKVLAKIRYRTRQYLKETHQTGLFTRNV